MKRLIICATMLTCLTGFSTTANAMVVTVIDAGYDETVLEESVTEEEDIVEAVADEEPEILDEPEEFFTGNYGSSDEDEWVDMEPEECEEHIWEYSYDDTEEEIVYFRFCLNCGYTEYIDECPEELEYTLTDYEEEEEEIDADYEEDN